LTIDSHSSVAVIVLTGGPGGGKSALLDHCATDAALAERIIVLEEAVRAMRGCGLEPRSPEFQCALVAKQIAAEDALKRTMVGRRKQVLLTHRGTLDPCAFWESFGHLRESFFEMTRSTLQGHYRRYDLVLHLESAAVRLPEAYLRYPLAHRPESAADAARLDELLVELWSNHPRYIRIAATSEIDMKLARALRIIHDFLAFLELD